MRVAAAVIALLVGSSGCGGGGHEAPGVKPISMAGTTAAAQRSERPACIKAPDEGGGILHAGAEGTRVTYCVGTLVDQCFALDLAKGALTSLPEPPKGQTAALVATARLETTDPVLKVCAEQTGCKTLTGQVWPGAAPLRAATNGTIAAVMLGEAEAGKGYVDIFDVAKPKKLASFKYARGEFKCGDLAILGETVYVNATVCAGTSGRATLYTTKGKKLAPVGGKPDFGTFGNAYTQVDGPLWAFLEESGTKLVLQDVVKGKVTKTIDTSALFAAGLGNPGESALVRLGGGKLAVVAGAPATGSVAVVDVTSGTVEIVRAPLCK
jgi:hypothetical protein